LNRPRLILRGGCSKLGKFGGEGEIRGKLRSTVREPDKVPTV